MKLFVAVTLLGLFLVTNGFAAPSWDFDDPADIETWGAVNQCNMSVENGMLKTESTGADPYFFPGGDWNNADWDPFSGANYSIIYMRLKVNQTNDWQVYYITEEDGTWGEAQRQNFPVEATGDFASVEFVMERGGWQEHTVNHFRIDPGTVAGIIAEIDYISLEGPVTAVDSKGKLPVLWSTLKR